MNIALPITADKREIKDFPKSRQVGTSFIRQTLDDRLKELLYDRDRIENI